MKTKTSYICEHCLRSFDLPCEHHEAKCLSEKTSAIRAERLFNILLGETTNDPIGAEINGVMFLLGTHLTKRSIKSFSSATKLVSVAGNPCQKDAQLIKRANEILSERI
jgi:hypothetical protein